MDTGNQSAKWLLLAILLGGTAIGAVGCEEGAFEEAGEELDDAADEVEDAVD